MSHLNLLTEAFFQEFILSIAPVHLYLKDIEGVYLAANVHQLKTLGFGHTKEILGKTDYDLYAKEDAERLRKNDQEVVKKGALITFEESGVMPNGEYQTYISNKMPFRDAENNIIGIIGASINITPLKEKEQALIDKQKRSEKAKLESETYLQKVIDHIPAHIYWEDRLGNLLGLNRLQAENIGCKNPKELLGKNIRDIAVELQWDKAMLEKLKQNDTDVLEKGMTVVSEEEINWSDGEPRVVLSQKAPLFDEENQCIGLVGLSMDITARKRAEFELQRAKDLAEQSNRLKTEFVANISHDLRTPLHAILGIAESLKAKKHYDFQDKDFDTLLSSGNLLLNLIDGILDFAKYEKNEFTVNLESFVLEDFLKQITEPIKVQTQLKGLDFYLECPTDLTKKSYLGDIEHIFRILMNLLGNALKFTKKGFVKLVVKSLESKPTFEVLEFTVKDTGIGIAPNEIDNIFERFYRTTLAAQGKFEGTGLGLAIAKKLVDHLKGTLHVYSKLGEGTEFICAFKFERYKPKRKLPKKINVKTKKITNLLLIEDSPLIQKFSIELLSQAGYQTASAFNAKEAFAKLEEEKFDLILLDLGLADMDGLEIIKILRNNPGKNQNTYLLVLTAHATPEVQAECLKVGANGFLIKPFTIKALIETIQNL